MVTAVARIELDLPGCRSLKDKRQILRSVLERTRSRFPISIAEIEDQDLWQRSVLGVAVVSGTVHHATEVLQKVVDYVTDAHAECEVLDHQVEVLTLF